MPRQPVLFLSHGSPMVLVESSPHRSFLQELGRTLARPEIIVSVTAHWTSPDLRVSTAARPATLRDFSGFPAPLYQIEYSAPGHPPMALRTAALLRTAGLDVTTEDRAVIDHGTWIPLALMWPDATIPVIEISVQPGRDAFHHMAVGRALAPLREQGAMIIGSGSITHNLRDYSTMPLDMPFGYADLFAEWVNTQVTAGDLSAMSAWGTAPFADRCHPTDEHFLPLPVAMAAGGGRGRRLFVGGDGPVMRLDCYIWDEIAPFSKS
jgi:4,5-DOPA dioxygenase extradiol